jgi:hypothetical protein
VGWRSDCTDFNSRLIATLLLISGMVLTVDSFIHTSNNHIPLRSEQYSAVDLLQNLAESSRRLEINRAKDLQAIKSRMEAGFEALRKMGNKTNVTSGDPNIGDAIFLNLSEQVRKAVTYAAERRIIQELSFAEMRQRQLDIKEAHYETFKWVFTPSSSHPSPTHFTEWLEHGDGTFWISGKPGSGKSTLMKYIVSHPQTGRLISRWAGESTLIAASFYFWSGGTPMQKSIDGLLRSLVCQVLRQCPSLIPNSFPEHWQSLMDAERVKTAINLSFDRYDIAKAFQSFTGAEGQNTKFCFFIDGLDEYDGFDREIAALIKTLASSPTIKICLASRPHNIFVSDFGSDPKQMICIHEFTDWDICQYIKTVFEGDPAFISCKDQDPQGYQELAESIRKDANGVFLWVYLVVLQLLDGIQNADRMQCLQKPRLAFAWPFYRPGRSKSWARQGQAN